MSSVSALSGAVPTTSTCAACGAPAPLACLARDTNRQIGSVSFPYYRCSACQVWALDPIPANLGDYYPKDYHAIPRTQADLEALSAIDQYKIDLVTQRLAGGRLLEIGPSYGMFQHLARKAGFRAEGIEMDAACCTFLTSLGFTVHQSAEPATTISQLGTFDCIVLWHVFEHLPRPWVALKAFAQALSPGGFLILSQPNPHSLQFRLLGKHWTHLDAPRHLHLVPPQAMTQQAALLGLTLVAQGGNDIGGLGWNRFGWVHSLRNLSGWRPLRFVLHVLARLIEVAVMPIERSGNRGSTYTAVFRKPA